MGTRSRFVYECAWSYIMSCPEGIYQSNKVSQIEQTIVFLIVMYLNSVFHWVCTSWANYTESSPFVFQLHALDVPFTIPDHDFFPLVVVL